MKTHVTDAIAARSSIRAYTDAPLTDDEVQTLIDAALAAPSAMHAEAWKIIAVTDRALIDEFEAEMRAEMTRQNNTGFFERMDPRGGRVVYGAPLFLAIAVDPAHGYADTDAGIAIQNVALAAQSMGLASVILGFPGAAFSGGNGESLRRKFGFPDGYRYGIGIAVGHAAMSKEPHPLDRAKSLWIK